MLTVIGSVLRAAEALEIPRVEEWADSDERGSDDGNSWLDDRPYHRMCSREQLIRVVGKLDQVLKSNQRSHTRKNSQTKNKANSQLLLQRHFDVPDHEDRHDAVEPIGDYCHHGDRICCSHKCFS
jgi:hypothetical protein